MSGRPVLEVTMEVPLDDGVVDEAAERAEAGQNVEAALIDYLGLNVNVKESEVRLLDQQ